MSGGGGGRMPKDDRELESRACKAGCRVENGGRHKKLVTPSGRRVPYPSGHGEIARGTMRAILKALAAAGVVLGAVACALQAAPWVWG